MFLNVMNYARRGASFGVMKGSALSVCRSDIAKKQCNLKYFSEASKIFLKKWISTFYIDIYLKNVFAWKYSLNFTIIILIFFKLK